MTLRTYELIGWPGSLLGIIPTLASWALIEADSPSEAFTLVILQWVMQGHPHLTEAEWTYLKDHAEWSRPELFNFRRLSTAAFEETRAALAKWEMRK